MACSQPLSLQSCELSAFGRDQPERTSVYRYGLLLIAKSAQFFAQPGYFRATGLAETGEHDDVGVVEGSAGDGEFLAIPRPGVGEHPPRLGIEVGQLHRWTAGQRLHIQILNSPGGVLRENECASVRGPAGI